MKNVPIFVAIVMSLCVAALCISNLRTPYAAPGVSPERVLKAMLTLREAREIIDLLASDDVGDTSKGPSIRQIINMAREFRGKEPLSLYRPADATGSSPQ